MYYFEGQPFPNLKIMGMTVSDKKVRKELRFFTDFKLSGLWIRYSLFFDHVQKILMNSVVFCKLRME